jgi:hypothetical protein
MDSQPQHADLARRASRLHLLRLHLPSVRSWSRDTSLLLQRLLAYGVWNLLESVLRPF